MKEPIKQVPTFVRRTYRGGSMLRCFLGRGITDDTFYPEDWISSFSEARNKDYVENEGLTVTESGRLLRDVVGKDGFGTGRTESGVLIKYLDASERLGVQVHPTVTYAKEFFGTEHGKTECWFILGTRKIGGTSPCIYLGFKPGVTAESWRELFLKQDIDGMLASLHRFEVKEGDIVLVRGGIPHAIGAGCFLLEIQEPSDYTMRVEKTTVAGEVLTDMQIHYGVGEDNMLACFDYRTRTRKETEDTFFLSKSHRNGKLVTYGDTDKFALEKVSGVSTNNFDFCTTVVYLKPGTIISNGKSRRAQRGDTFFVPANTEYTVACETALICFPPLLKNRP